MHQAYIAKITNVIPIEGANTVQLAIVMNTQLVVSKTSQIGDIGVFFPSELQLSEAYCYENNLHRHSHLNKDPEQKGYFEDNRRVRAQPFLKQKSDGYFAPLDSLKWTGYDISQLTEGMAFDTLNGKEICRKYFSEKTLQKMKNRMGKVKKIKVTEAPAFVLHRDTDQFNYYVDKIPKGCVLTIDHKTHGTSGRWGYVQTIRLKPCPNKMLDKVFTVLDIVAKPIKKHQKAFEFIQMQKIAITHWVQHHQNRNTFWNKMLFKKEYEYVAGSRRVNLFEDKDSNKEGFHGSESYRFEILEKLKPYLMKNMVMFGEIFGYVNGSPIMAKHSTDSLKDKEFQKKYGKEIVYSYGCLPDMYKFKIYRIAFVNEDGQTIDMTVPQMINYCETFNIPYTKPLYGPEIYDGDAEKLKTLVYDLADRPDKLTEDYVDPTHVNEGVVVRIDQHTLVPDFYKHKSWAFKVMEGIAKEKDDSVDLEDIS